ncbi:hypothetical protein DFH07DRAFT_815742 [Mycena maculata]|uniref:Uncharacterized protein n=1 Tax=Mycena maculata TaxID=230809 RepID=A0AAD7IJR0_9AGAR|nr:hypothetical protein DFH07DRAFT_857422 [Mycena maculata]KAJ7744763.1 hypothetical protein DFH07DRAFT_834270 [Mycena maculata]KAJ7761208.1 hypothetical protein DFH07DRAFT_815742 [Mycena maculata]
MAGYNERKAQDFMKDLVAINKGNLDPESYRWPNIDYGEVSPATCNSILSLLGEPDRGKFDTLPDTPETPQKHQIARMVDLQVKKRAYLAAQRISDAKDLELSLKSSLLPIYDWLKDVRRGEDMVQDKRTVNFTLYQRLNAIRQALDEVEALIRGPPEDDVTEYSESESGNTTAVAYR